MVIAKKNYSVNEANFMNWFELSQLKGVKHSLQFLWKGRPHGTTYKTKQLLMFQNNMKPSENERIFQR